jgi:hypothetical protein
MGIVFLGTSYAYAASQTVIVDPRDTETLSFYLKEGDKIRFQISVDGGRNDDINMQIKNPIGGIIIGGGIEDSFSDTITAQTTGNYIFEFDNGISLLSSKRVDFSYDIIKRPVAEAISNTARDAVGGCLIATATYGSELAPQVQQLRELRDNQLLQTESGTSFMNTFNEFYYSFSPIIADYERENPVFREMVKVVITPMITSLSILNYVDMDSEAEVLGYGISLIVLNVGMYVGVPVVAMLSIRKFM